VNATYAARVLARAVTSRRPMPATPPARKRITLLALCLAAFIISLDVTIVNVALPSLVRQTGATTTDLQWVVDAYNLVFATLVLVAGSLSDRLGRKGMLLAGLGVFGAASLAGSLAASGENHFAVSQIEVDGELRTILGFLPTARDGASIVADRPYEPLREWRTLALEYPLPAVNAHGVDTAHSALVAVELDIGAIGAVATHDRDAVRGTRHIDDGALDEMRLRGMPLKTCPACTGPRLSVWAFCLHCPLAHERL
jgi:hypothetical protein